MDPPHRKRPPPIHPSPLSRTILPPDTVTIASAVHFLPDPVEGVAEVHGLAQILWRYGQSIETLRYSVGRESSLPCSKSVVRRCMLTAISLAHDVNTRERLRAGYVQLEVFITDAEFEIVRELQDRLGEAGALGRYGCSPRMMQRIAARREGAGTPARVILTRVAEQMLVRQRELR